MVDDSKWRGDNGTFKSRYLNQLEKMLKKELSKSKIKANPHIESRIRLLKRQYNIICEMITTKNSFEWNNQEKCMNA